MKELIIALAVLFVVALIIFVLACCKAAGRADEAVSWPEIEDSNKPPEPIVIETEFGEAEK